MAFLCIIVLMSAFSLRGHSPQMHASTHHPSLGVDPVRCVHPSDKQHVAYTFDEFLNDCVAWCLESPPNMGGARQMMVCVRGWWCVFEVAPLWGSGGLAAVPSYACDVHERPGAHLPDTSYDVPVRSSFAVRCYTVIASSNRECHRASTLDSLVGPFLDLPNSWLRGV